MQAVVKTPRIDITIRGAAIPPKLIDVLREEYGAALQLEEDGSEELVDALETAWYKSIKEKMTPGAYLRIYRENKKMTQAGLGNALGGVPRQHVSNMEHGQRSISLKMARKLSTILDVPLEKFIEQM